MSRTPVLFVTEKPSIAKTLSEVLGKGQHRSRPSCSRFNPCFDFELDVPGTPQRYQVTVTSVCGHLMSLDFEARVRNWRSVQQKELFDASVERFVTKGSEPIAQNLQAEAPKVKMLVIWTDCDREGEAIGEEIVRTCAEVNDRLVVKRARFSAANAADLWKAVGSLRELNYREVDAVLARQEIDLRLGAVFTRFQTLSLQASFQSVLGEQIISFGPCQFPTLGFVVARYGAIQAFQEETFWMIRMFHNTVDDGAVAAFENDQNQSRQAAIPAAAASSQMFEFHWHRHRLFDHVSALVCFELCYVHNLATVEDVTRKQTRKFRPFPLSTVELQIRSSNVLRLDSETTMKVAEILYQRGIISYPRTETEIFADSFDLRAIVNGFRGNPLFGQYADRLLDQNGFEPPRRGKKDDQAHPPIHPTAFIDPASLGHAGERAVYEFVCRHFLACCSKDAMGADSTIRAKIAGETFTAKGLVVHERNYLDVYRYESWSTKSIPNLSEGDSFTPTRLELQQGRTQAPRLLSEAQLIRLMDKNGIGTDATIQEHVKTIQEREYAKKVAGDLFEPTPLGVALLKAYESMGHARAFSKPDMRAELERNLTKICRGEITKDQVVLDAVNRYRAVFLDVCRKRDVLSLVVGEMLGGAVMETPEQENQRVERVYDVLITADVAKCGACQCVSLELRRDSKTQKQGIRCVNSVCPRVRQLLGPFSPSWNMQPKPDGFSCLICQYQVWSCTSSNSTSSWFLCPSCFVKPPEGALFGNGQDVEDMAMIDPTMPCFKCAKAGCALANGVQEDSVFPCSDCGGTSSMILKKNATGSYYLKCKSFASTGCRGTRPLPRCVKNITVSPQTCPTCHAQKLVFGINRSEAPPGTMPVLTECPNLRSCSAPNARSSDFRNILEMESIQCGPPRQAVVLRQQPVPPRQGIASGGAPPRQAVARGAPPRPLMNQTSKSNPPRGPVLSSSLMIQPNAGPRPAPIPTCFKCGQTGHYPVQCRAGGGGGASQPLPVISQPARPMYQPARPMHQPPMATQQVQGGNSNNDNTNNNYDNGGGGGGPNRTQDQCYKCKQTGHWASACPNGFSNAAAAAAPPPPRMGNGRGPSAAPAARGPRGAGGSTSKRICTVCGTALEYRKRKCSSCGTVVVGQRGMASNKGGSGGGVIELDDGNDFD